MFEANAPGAYYNLALQLDTRDWYLAAHPECSNSYWNLVETAGHEPWRADTAASLQAFLRQIEARYGDRVFAYSLLCGSSTEWYTNSQGRGRPEAQIREHPIKTAAFRKFTGDPTATMPPLDVLQRTSHGVFRDPVADAAALRYWRFHHEIIGDAILYFAGKAQEVLQHRKLLGLVLRLSDAAQQRAAAAGGAPGLRARLELSGHRHDLRAREVRRAAQLRGRQRLPAHRRLARPARQAGVSRGRPHHPHRPRHRGERAEDPRREHQAARRVRLAAGAAAGVRPDARQANRAVVVRLPRRQLRQPGDDGHGRRVGAGAGPAARRADAVGGGDRGVRRRAVHVPHQRALQRRGRPAGASARRTGPHRRALRHLQLLGPGPRRTCRGIATSCASS